MHHYSPTPRGWQCLASASPKISRLVGTCSIQRIFWICRSRNAARRTSNMMLRFNGLTASLRVHRRGHGWPDGDMIAVGTTRRSALIRYR
jgi:hypothetical protein